MKYKIILTFILTFVFVFCSAQHLSFNSNDYKNVMKNLKSKKEYFLQEEESSIRNDLYLISENKLSLSKDSVEKFNVLSESVNYKFKITENPKENLIHNIKKLRSASRPIYILRRLPRRHRRSGKSGKPKIFLQESVVGPRKHSSVVKSNHFGFSKSVEDSKLFSYFL